MEDESVVPVLDGISEEMQLTATEEGATPDKAKKQKKKKVKSKMRFSPDFGFAEPTRKDAPSYAFGNYIANEIGVELSVKLLKDALATHTRTATDTASKLTFLRETFRNPGAFIKIFWHEFSHMLDSAAGVADGIITDPITDESLEPWRQTPSFNKFLRVYQDFKTLGLEEDRDSFNAEVDALNMAFIPYTKKPGTEYTEYRGLGTEQFANAMSSILTDPENVRDNYPRYGLEDF